MSSVTILPIQSASELVVQVSKWVGRGRLGWDASMFGDTDVVICLDVSM